MAITSASITAGGIVLHGAGADDKKKPKRELCMPYTSSSESGSSSSGVGSLMASSDSGGRAVATGKPGHNDAIPYHNILWIEKKQDDDVYDLSYVVETKKNKFSVREHAVKIANEGLDVVEHVLATAYKSGVKRQKRFLVLINPHGGPGRAAQIYHHSCEPILKAAKCQMTVITTTHRYHGQEIAEQMDIGQYDAIICCSGDGIPHEVINGLSKRADAAHALKTMPLCQLPCGSGNSMALSLNGYPSATLAALNMVKGKPLPADLMSFNQGDKLTFSFLSQTYGVVADSDLGTEHLRWMGGTRFAYGMVMRALSQTKYPCEIYVKYSHEDKPAVTEHFKRSLKSDSQSKEVSSSLDSTHQQESVVTADDAIPSAAAAADSSSSSGLPPLHYGTTNDPIPSDWSKLERPNLGLFWVGKMPWMSADAMVFPATLPADGMLDMVIWDSTIGRHNALQLLLKLESGEHFHSKHVQYSKILAYRLVPKIPKGFISIDGEDFPFEPFQVEVVPSAGCLLSATGAYTKTNLHSN